MSQQNISVILFAAFIALVAGRAVMLRQRGIRAIVFGATDKSDFLLVPFVFAIIYTVCSGTFGLPIWKPLVVPFWQTQIPGVVGLVLCSVAVIGMVASLVSFGNSSASGLTSRSRTDSSLRECSRSHETRYTSALTRFSSGSFWFTVTL